MSWEGYERQRESARAIRQELYEIAETLDTSWDECPPALWLAISYVVAGRMDSVKGLLENLQWALYTAIYDQEPDAIKVGEQPKNLPPPAGG